MLRRGIVGNTLRGNVRRVWQAFVASSRPLVRHAFMAMCASRGIAILTDDPASQPVSANSRLALIDLDSAGESGAIGTISQPVKRLVLAGRLPSPRLGRELAQGVDAVVTSQDRLVELGWAIDAVVIGEAYASKSAAKLMLEMFRSTRPTSAGRTTALSDRERDVLKLLAHGMTTKGMARTLGISVKTVEAHRSRLFAKLQVKTQAQAVARATADASLLSR